MGSQLTCCQPLRLRIDCDIDRIRYERMYLHVDMGDPAATGLYSSMGYESLVKYDSPLWMRRLFGWPTIRYQVKHFKGRKGAAAVTAAAGSEKSGI